MNKVVVVEDDIYLREEIIDSLQRKGYTVEGISSFDFPENAILEAKPDIVVLDVNLPGRSGFELCRMLKARASFPILILTARDTLADELYALGLGADDYLTKPCHPDRLTARVGRLLHTYDKVRDMIEAGALILDTGTYKAVCRDRHTVLSETEGKILGLLMRKCPDVVTKEELFDELWGGAEFVDENILQVNITRLRKSMGAMGLDGAVINVRGQGYRLEVSAE